MPSMNSGAKFTWLGHATFLVETPTGKKILIDPWVSSNPACPSQYREIEECDLILVTHAHFDHIADVILIANRTGAPVVGIVELLHWLGSKGVTNLKEMNKGGTQRIGDISITMVHADHSCGITDGDQILYGGEAVGYVVTLENGFRFYHAGDTNVFGDMALISELYSPSLVMIPIGDHYTMSPKEAAKAVELLNAPYVLPMHFGTFPVLTGTPSDLKLLLNDKVASEIFEIQPGDTIE